tara:strand:+ start:407 stop:511 length:105 start_codon:yes stop_codon:yes gene_type:complete
LLDVPWQDGATLAVVAGLAADGARHILNTLLLLL